MFEFEGTLARSCQELIWEFESPALLSAAACVVLLLLLLLLMGRLLGRLLIGCMGRTTAFWMLPWIKEATLSYPLAIFADSVWMLERKGLKGLWEEEACSCSCMQRRPTGLFTAAPLAFAYASVSSLSCLPLCSFSWPLCWTASPSAGERGFRNSARGFTLARWELVSEITVKPL